MPPTEFKLSRRNGITRRTAFPDRPTWKALSSRASELFDIPLDQLAAAYIDSDGDEVTLNTEEELSHFYQTSATTLPIKFFIQDLTSLRSQAPSAFLSSNLGPEPPAEEEWHTFDGIFVPAPSLASPHVFVGDAGNNTDSIYKSLPETGMKSSLSPATVDKGKAKAVKLEDLTQSLASSVISGDAPAKPPVHVYDYSSILGESPHVSPSALAESTPKAPLREMDNQEDNNRGSNMHTSVDDPPLPPIVPQTPPSLSNDFANLISSLGNVLFSHPELSEGIQNIVRNTSDGTYWRAHRDALSKAAEEISQASGAAVQDVLRESEAEASQRVWQALDAFFRSLSQVTGIPKTSSPPAQQPAGSNATSQNQPSSSAAVDSEPKPVIDEEDRASQPELPHEEQPPVVNRSSEWRSYLRPFYPPSSFTPQSFYSQPPLPPAFPQNSFGYFHPPPRHPFAPPPFPPPPHTMPPPPPPPPPPPAEPLMPYGRDHSHLGRSFSLNSPLASHAPEVVEMKAKVQAAKSMYRAEKARYLQEREQARRRQRGGHWFGAEQTDETQPFEGLPSFTVPQGVTNAAGSQSPFIPGTFPLQYRPRPFHDTVIEDFRSRAVKRICRQLSDMGFTESSYPGLAEKVAARLPAKGSIAKETEDGIVTNLLEELLLTSFTATGPTASGSKATGVN